MLEVLQVLNARVVRTIPGRLLILGPLKGKTVLHVKSSVPVRPKSLFFLLFVLTSQPFPAQTNKNLQVFVDKEPEERGSARVLFWDEKKNAAAGQFAIDFGRPLWKKDYEKADTFDGMTKGKVWRMGKNFWTVLDTSLPLRISGKAVPVGAYYLGLHRSDDGHQWSLAFIDPARVRKARLDAFEIGKAPVQFKIPVTLERAAGITEKFTISFSQSVEKPESITLKIAWGKLHLSAPIQVMPGN